MTDFAEAFFGEDLEPEEDDEKDALAADSSGTHHQNGDSSLEKIAVKSPNAEELTEFEGRYYNAELETVYTLRVEEGKLMANHRKNEAFSLTHKESDEFSSVAWYMGQIRCDRDP